MTTVQFRSAMNTPRSPRPWMTAPERADLSALDAAEIDASLDHWPGRWCAEPWEAYDGETSVVLMPQDEAAAPSFVLRRERGCFVLDALRGDCCDRLGSYDTLARAMQAAAMVLRGLWLNA